MIETKKKFKKANLNLLRKKRMYNKNKHLVGMKIIIII